MLVRQKMTMMDVPPLGLQYIEFNLDILRICDVEIEREPKAPKSYFSRLGYLSRSLRCFSNDPLPNRRSLR